MSLDNIRIGDHNVSSVSDPFIIAEISANHNNDIERAKNLIYEAARSGAQAVKFQTYTADTLTLDSDEEDFVITGGIWDGRKLYDIYREGSLPYEWHKELFTLSKSLGLAVISTPFDEAAVDFLVELGADALKIASFELCHIPLLRKVGSTGLPVIMSTGMGEDDEISEALQALNLQSTQQVVLLHCISSYPAQPTDSDLRRIEHLAEKFGTMVGLSDHCVENHIALASIVLGACVIEKHFTLDRNGGGLDDSFSILPDELHDLRRLTAELKKSLNIPKDRGSADRASKKYRRSVYASNFIQKGELFTENNIQVVRPGFGLHPRYFSELLGTTANRDIAFAEPLTHKEIEK